jgi:uncharacterized protein
VGKNRQFSLPLTLKRADAATAGTFTGLAATWERDRANDVIQRGAFGASLADFAARGASIPLLWMHDPGQPVGAIATATETDVGLEVTGRLALGAEPSDRAFALLKVGALAMSVGFVIQPGGARIDSEGRIISAADLAEISLVTIPMNPGAVIQDVKSALYASPAAMARVLREGLGLTRREAEAVAKAAWPALPHASDPDPEAIADAAELAGAIAYLKSAIER